MNNARSVFSLLISLGVLAGCAAGTPTPFAIATAQSVPAVTREVEASLTPSQTLTPIMTQAAPPKTPTDRLISTPVSPTLAATKQTRVTPSPTATVCTRETGWFSYIIQSGDTLSRIAQRAQITVIALKEANCLTSNVIFTGDRLYTPKQISPQTGSGASNSSVLSTEETDFSSNEAGSGSGGPFATPCAPASSTCLNGEDPTETATCRANDESCHGEASQLPSPYYAELTLTAMAGLCEGFDETCYDGLATIHAPTAACMFVDETCFGGETVPTEESTSPFVLPTATCFVFNRTCGSGDS